MERDVVAFEVGKPVEVALMFGQGRPVQGVNGPRVMFSLVDGRVMFLDPEPAKRVSTLGVKAREPFFIAKYRKGGQVEWNAWLGPEAEKGRALGDARAAGDTWTAGKLEKSIAQGRTVAAVIGALPALANGKGQGRPAPRPLAADPPAAPASGSRLLLQAWALAVLAQTRQMIDVYASAVQYVEQEHGGRVKREEVLSMMLAAFAKGKKGGPDVA